MKGVDAVPHDLLKVIAWGKHASSRVIRDLLPGSVREKYRIDLRGMDGNLISKSLEDIISGHHSTKGFWRKLLNFSDRLSAVAGRLKLEYDYWYRGQADPFFVKVYGDIVVWTEERRKSLWENVKRVLMSYSDREEKHKEAFIKVNEILKEFPADSEFPFTSLKSHHWLMNAICKNRYFWSKCVRATERNRYPDFDELYMIRISLAEPEFHRLREIRAFSDLRRRAVESAHERLSDYSPLLIGDDLYLVCVDGDEVDIVQKKLEDLGFGFDLDVFKWYIEGVRFIRVDGKERTYFRVKGYETFYFSVGALSDWEPRPESSAEWSKVLMGDYEYVAWVSVKPKGDMEEIAKCFLDWGERELEKRFGEIRIKVEKPIRQCVSLSPELAVSIAESYDEFLRDCVGVVRGGSLEPEVTVVRSFGRSIFIRGLRDLFEAFNLYWGLYERRMKLHIPVVISIVTAKPKYPFWKILELFGDFEADGKGGIAFIVGEKMVKLSDEDVRLLRQVVPALRNCSRSQFNEIITLSRRVGLEELKLRIEGKAKDNKIPRETSNKLCWFISKLSDKYEGEELKAVIYRSLKMVMPFTRKDRRR